MAADVAGVTGGRLAGWQDVAAGRQADGWQDVATLDRRRGAGRRQDVAGVCLPPSPASGMASPFLPPAGVTGTSGGL